VRALEEEARSEAENSPPPASTETAPRPRVDVGKPAEPAPNPFADDGFMKMLQGVQ
jgi:hypothetical protein